MEKRTCRNCGLDNYSADSRNDWKCHTCGALIKKPRPIKVKLIIRDGHIIGYVGKNF